MKGLCVKMSGVGALLICIPVVYRIHAGDVFNPASYFLWAALSLVCFVVLLRAKDGGHTLLAGYFLSELIIGLYACVKSGKATLGKFEWFIVALTAACAAIYVWCEASSRKRGLKAFKPSVIVNGIACMIAGMPLLVDSIRDPRKMSFTICALYIIISWLGYYGEKTFNGKFIPGLSILYWAVIVVGMLVSIAFY